MSEEERAHQDKRVSRFFNAKWRRFTGKEDGESGRPGTERTLVWQAFSWIESEDYPDLPSNTLICQEDCEEFLKEEDWGYISDIFNELGIMVIFIRVNHPRNQDIERPRLKAWLASMESRYESGYMPPTRKVEVDYDFFEGDYWWLNLRNIGNLRK